MTFDPPPDKAWPPQRPVFNSKDGFGDQALGYGHMVDVGLDGNSSEPDRGTREMRDGNVIMGFWERATRASLGKRRTLCATCLFSALNIVDRTLYGERMIAHTWRKQLLFMIGHMLARNVLAQHAIDRERLRSTA